MRKLTSLLTFTVLLAFVGLSACATEADEAELVEAGDDGKADGSTSRELVVPLGLNAPYKDYVVKSTEKWVFDDAIITMPRKEVREVAALYFSINPSARFYEEPIFLVETFAVAADGTVGARLDATTIGYLVHRESDGDLVVGDFTPRILELAGPLAYKPGESTLVRFSLVEGALPPAKARAGHYLDTEITFMFERGK